jgi:recombination protein RecA
MSFERRRNLMSLNHVNNTDAANKKKALDLALSTIEKQFGKGAIMRLDSAEAAEKILRRTTGTKIFISKIYSGKK